MDATAVHKPTDKTKGLLCLLLAAALLGAIAFFYASIADSGLHVYDERAYISIAHRFVMGDRPIADDWSTALTLSFFLSLPVKIFTEATGSTEGIVLFCRYFFIAVHTAFSLFLFAVLQKYRWAAVIASLLYICYIPLEMFSLNYNTISLMAVISIGLLLFTGKEPGRGKLLAAGILSSVAVVALPPLALLYLFYSVFILLRFLIHRKKKDASPSPLYLTPEGWLSLTGGVAVCAVIFFVYLFSRMSFQDVTSAVSGIMTQLSSSYHSNLSADRFWNIINTIGIPQCLFAVVLLVFAFASQKRSIRQKSICLGLVAVDTIAMSVSIYLTFYGKKGDTNGDIFAAMMRMLPLVFAGGAAWLLTRNRNRRWFSFYLFCIAYALVRDISSNVIFGLGSVGAGIASVFLIGSFLTELRQSGAGPGEKTGVKMIARCLCVLILTAAVSGEAVWKKEEIRYRALENYYMRNTTALTDEISRGPLKGIKTTFRVRSVIENMMQDLDDLRAGGKKQIYIAGTHQWAYLYLEDSYTACSAMFNEKNIAVSQMYYWELHPEKRPDFIYIPLYDTGGFQSIRAGVAKITDTFNTLCSFHQAEGRAGYILSDIVWN